MRFNDIAPSAPNEESIRSEYGAVCAALEAALNVEDARTAVESWDRLRKRIDTYSSLVNLRFSQDVRDPERKAAQESLDALEPLLREHEVRAKRALLASPVRTELERSLGQTVFALWECSVTTFEPAIADPLVQESKLSNTYTELLGKAEVTFDGQRYNLSEIGKFFESPDRDTRYRAATAHWQWFDDHREQLDTIFDDLVKVRHGMATTLGYPIYTDLAYRLMSRIDYGQSDVESFRAEVREQIVPLCARLREQQAATLDLDSVMLWDEKIHDLAGNPKPLGDAAWMTDQARAMFKDLHPELADFFNMMADGDFLDLQSREGKAGGGFCTSLPDPGVPFIFANFNGTRGDVEVFTHEVGHAFQYWMSRDKFPSDLAWPTIEACEIHSMSLEFLTAPQMERFFGADAERFRQIHLKESLLFIPYGVAVDHFQHLIYAQPDASPAERNAMWREMEATYLPWRQYGDLPHVNSGGFWQRQLHIYRGPFYYIDYALAQTCALQFWVRAEQDPNAALLDYVTLCRRGGEAPFQQLAQSAGLRSPFERGCLTDVARRAASELIL